MLYKTAHIQSKGPHLHEKMICGLYPLERIIHVLKAAGVKKFYLNLSDEESQFYHNRIKKHVRKIKGIEIYDGLKPKSGTSSIEIPSGLFMQAHYFESFKKYFRKKNKHAVPVTGKDQFIVDDADKASEAERLIKKRLIDTTQGFISKKINKRISVPMSVAISPTRIHPNILTLVNLVIGTLSAVAVFNNTYWSIALGGFLFQFASIFDGVDGEVAKFTFRSSKFGGWLDTVCDHLILLFMLISMSYLYYLNTGLVISILTIGGTIAGLVFIIKANLDYIKEFKTSQSLKAYDTEFILKLPASDMKVAFILKTRYLTKKEFYSMVIFLTALAGKIHYCIPVFTVVTVVGSIILYRINYQYFPKFKSGEIK